MHNFTFYNPTKIVFGKGTIPEIGKELSSRGLKKVLLLAGGGSIKKNGVYDQTTQSLKENEVDWVEMWGVRSNPELDKVRETIDRAKKEDVDAILGVGGGSVIDSAKAVAAGCRLDDVWEAFGMAFEVEEALPVYSVLTLSATGTEMNQFAVVTNTEEHKKWPIMGPALFPVVSIVDPSVQAFLPQHQTVYGGIDALSHIMENHFIGTKEETTLSVNEGLMRAIIKTVDTLVVDPNDYDSRASLAWATTLALNGISGVGLNGGDWATHFIEHSVSAFHPEVAHAAGLAILFPAWIQHMQSHNPDGFKRWAKEVWNADRVEQGIENMKKKYNEWGVATRLRDVEVTEDELETLADNATLLPLGTLKQLTKEDVLAILKIAY